MPVSGKTPSSRSAGLRGLFGPLESRPASAAAAAFVVTLAAMLAARRWFDPALFICVAATFLLATGVFMLVSARRNDTSASSESSAGTTQSALNEARMMAIVRSSMEAIITIDDQQRVVIFNPMAEQVFGCSAKDAIGAPLARFIPERFRAVHAQHVGKFGVTGVSDRQMGKQRVLAGLRANGEEFPLEASISQIHDGDTRLYTVMLRDIAERVSAERAQRQAHEELRELSANLQNIREDEKTRIARELHEILASNLPR
jgi:two-component system sensor kinase